MKNSKKQYLIIGSLLMSVIMGSCKKEFLDRTPYTSVNTNAAINTPSDLQAALTGAYSTLRSSNLYGRSIPVLGDILADNIFVSTANSGRYVPQSTYSVAINDGTVSSYWSDAYNAILKANNIINAPINSDDVKQGKGEAYAIRALVYFNLVRTFAKPYSDDPNSPGVPIVLTFNKDALPKRNTVAEVYTQILADLTQATTLMTSYNGSGTFSKYAALALQAKVNLSKGDYQNAYTEAKDVITNSGFTLVSKGDLPGYWAAVTPHDPSVKVETLFEVVSDAINNNSTDELSSMFVQGGSSYGDLLATKSLYDLYSATDVRKSLIIVGARQKIGGENPAYVVNKYAATVGDYNDKKVIRLSEVYLIAAEAANKLGNDGDALVNLNTLIAQRDPSLIYASAGAQLFSDIILERRKELAFEGDRFYDLNRLKQDVIRTPEYQTGNISYSDTRRISPIPQSELNVNPNIVQNPGY